MLRRDIAASSLKVLCKNFIPVKSYGKTNMPIFVLRLWKKYRWGLICFGQLRYNEPRHENTCLCHMRTTKAQSDQHLCCLLPSIISLVSTFEISSLYLASVSAQAGLSLTKDRFSREEAPIYHANPLYDANNVIVTPTSLV